MVKKQDLITLILENTFLRTLSIPMHGYRLYILLSENLN